MPPSVFSIQVNAAFTDWSFVMSHSTAFNWPSDPNSPSRNCSTLSLRLDNPQTIIPARHNSEQIALPMPLLAPVTTATFPCHRSIVEHQNEIVVSSPQIDTQMNQMFDQIEISAQHSRFRSHYHLEFRTDFDCSSTRGGYQKGANGPNYSYLYAVA